MPSGLRGGEVHVIESRAAQREKLHPEGSENLQARTIRLIIHEDAHRLRSLGRRSGLGAQPEFVESPRDALRAGCLREVFTVVGFGVEDGGRDHDSRDVGDFAAHPFFKLDHAIGGEAHAGDVEP